MKERATNLPMEQGVCVLFDLKFNIQPTKRAYGGRTIQKIFQRTGGASSTMSMYKKCCLIKV